MIEVFTLRLFRHMDSVCRERVQRELSPGANHVADPGC
jgi:hypothetical protein